MGYQSRGTVPLNLKLKLNVGYQSRGTVPLNLKLKLDVGYQSRGTVPLNLPENVLKGADWPLVPLAV